MLRCRRAVACAAAACEAPRLRLRAAPPTTCPCTPRRLQLGSHPFFARMRGLDLGSNPVFSKGREAAESIRERWETSDSPLVHRIQVGRRCWQSSCYCGRAAPVGPPPRGVHNC